MISFESSVFAGVGALCLAICSCGEMNKPLAGGGMLMEPAMAPAGFGNSSTRPKFHEVHVFAATAEQRRAAEQRARAAMKSSAVASRVKREKVQYVAVPVKRNKSQTGRGASVMKVNVATGVSTGEVFVSEDAGPKDGDKIKLGGDSTLFFATTGDKL
jgi:hypothetical protein